MIAKLERAQSNVQKHGVYTESHNGRNNQQRVTNRTAALERIAASATGWLKSILP